MNCAMQMNCAKLVLNNVKLVQISGISTCNIKVDSKDLCKK